jgi:hypothetical protein
VRARKDERLFAVRDDVRGHAFSHEPTSDQARHAELVLDDEHAHAHIVTDAA